MIGTLNGGNSILNLINPILNFGRGGCSGGFELQVSRATIRKIIENYNNYLQNFCDTCKYLDNLLPYFVFVFCTREMHGSIDSSIKCIYTCTTL
jgi:hypothetical protein